MKYPKSILLNLTTEDYSQIMKLAEMKRTTANSILRGAVVEILKANGMDPLAKEKTPSQIAG